MPVSVKEVTSREDREAFIDVGRLAQAGNPQWVEPARVYLDTLLDPAHSPVMAENEVTLFLALRDGRPVGRVAATKNAAHLKKYDDATGHFGLLEAIDDAEVFTALFEATFAALRAKGLTRIAGPFSLTINHETGLLVEGFHESHVVHTNHAPPYYATRLEAMGFGKLMDVESWVVRLAETDFPARVARAAARVPESREIVLSGINPGNWAARTGLLNTMYNDIWQENWGSTPVTAAEGRMIAKLTLPTSKLSWLRIAFYRNEPIALLTLIPDTNEALRGLKGKLLPFGWATLMRRIHIEGTKMTRVPMFGLKRRWHRTKIGSLAANMLMSDAMERARKGGATEMEISWILETNTVFRNMVAALPARRSRVFRIYERLL